MIHVSVEKVRYSMAIRGGTIDLKWIDLKFSMDFILTINLDFIVE